MTVVGTKCAWIMNSEGGLTLVLTYLQQSKNKSLQGFIWKADASVTLRSQNTCSEVLPSPW